MKTILTVLCTILTLYSFSQSGITSRQKTIQDIRAKQKAAIGKSFPYFSASSGDSVLTNADFKGKVVYINFWFEACLPCIAEFAGLNKLYDSLQEKKDVDFISFTFESPERIKAVKQKYNIKYKIVSLKREECQLLNQGSGYPTHIILNKEGKIKYFSNGGNTNKDRATAHIMNNIYPRIIEGL